MTSEVPDHIQRLAAAIRAPQRLTAAGLRDRFGDLAQVEPAPGQVWRARWGEVARLVLLLEAEDRLWNVVPVSVEPTGEDESSLVVDGSRTAFEVEVTAWAGLCRSIPTGTLSRIVDQWDHDVSDWCRSTADGIAVEAPPGTRPGHPISVAGDSSSSTRDTLADDLEVLAEAPLVPTSSTSAVNLRVAAKSVGLAAVVSALGLPQPEVMLILQRKRPVTAEQASALASLFKLPAQEITAAAGALPVDLAVELEQPRWRSTWRRLARRFSGDEVMARLTAGYGTFGMAYRQTGVSAPDWRGRVGQWLSTQSDLEGSADE